MHQQQDSQNNSPQPGQTYYYHPDFPQQSGPQYVQGREYQPVIPPNENPQYRTQAKQITRRGQWIGLALLAIQVLGPLAVFGFGKLMNLLLPGAGQSPSVFYDAMEYAVYSPVAILVPFLLVPLFCKTPLSQLIPFENHRFGLSLGCMLFCFWGISAGNFSAGIVGTAFPQIEEALESAMGANPANPMELVLNILYVAAIPALVEEFAFRGVTMGLLRPYGDRFALLTSSLLFALLHGNFIQIPFAFFVGLVLGYATLRTGSIVPAIVVHFINNATSCLLEYFEPQLIAWFGQNYGVVLYALWALLGLAGFLILKIGYRKQGMTAWMQPYTGCLSAGRRTGSFYRAGLLIAAMAVYLLTALLMMVKI